MKWWHYSLIGALSVVALLVSYRAGQQHPLPQPVEPTKERVDTLFIRDTITAYKPISVTRTRTERIYVPADTITIHDTLMVLLDRSSVEWRDSLCAVYASGVNPQVDSVRHFVRSEVITREIPVIRERKTRWGIGVQAGYGVSVQGVQPICTPYVGIGISYNIISW